MTEDVGQRRRRVVLEACRELGLDSWDAGQVETMMTVSEADWPACCESGCEPCVDLLASAARLARARLDP